MQTNNRKIKNIKKSSNRKSSFTVKTEPSSPIQNISKITSSTFNIYSIIIIVALSFVLYGNTISYDYALDDCMMITDNKFTKEGIHGIKDILSYDSFKGYNDNVLNAVNGGRYRPLSIITFALEYEFFGMNPHISHFINILLYALTGIFIFLILKKLFLKYSKPKWYLTIPFISAILFIAHPIHTEVVANIKSRDELFALLFSLLTLFFILKYFDKSNIFYLILGLLMFFLALLSKEIAVVFVIIIPLFLYFFKDYKFKKLILSFSYLFIIAIVFIILRQMVIGKTGTHVINTRDIMNNSFAAMTGDQKYATIFFTLGWYLKLLFFPHPLTYDYYPYHIPIMEWSNISVLLSLIIYGLMIFYAIKGLKTKKYFSFCILMFLIPLSLTANILFPVGVFMGERFIYISSLGFVLLLAYLMIEKPNKFFKQIFVQPLWFIIPVLGLYAFKTIDRNKAWENNFTLYQTDVKTSFNSAHSNHSYGLALSAKAEKAKDKSEQAKLYDSALVYLDRSFKIDPNNQNVNYLLGKIYGKYKNDMNKAIYYLNNAMNLDPNNIESYNDLGIAYAISGQYNKSIEIFENGLKIDPKNIGILKNLAVSYNNIGNKKKFQECLDKAKLLETHPK